MNEVKLPIEQFPDGTATRIDIDGAPVAVVRIGEQVYAIGDTCSHARVSLSDGELWADELELECPRHGSAFSLVTGKPNALPASRPVPVYAVTVGDGSVTIRLDQTPCCHGGCEL